MYQIPDGYKQALEEFIKEQLKKGYIRHSKSPYASPLFFVKKKNGKPRSCYGSNPIIIFSHDGQLGGMSPRVVPCLLYKYGHILS